MMAASPIIKTLSQGYTRCKLEIQMCNKDSVSYGSYSNEGLPKHKENKEWVIHGAPQTLVSSNVPPRIERIDLPCNQSQTLEHNRKVALTLLQEQRVLTGSEHITNAHEVLDLSRSPPMRKPCMQNMKEKEIISIMN